MHGMKRSSKSNVLRWREDHGNILNCSHNNNLIRLLRTVTVIHQAKLQYPRSRHNFKKKLRPRPRDGRREENKHPAPKANSITPPTHWLHFRVIMNHILTKERRLYFNSTYVCQHRISTRCVLGTWPHTLQGRLVCLDTERAAALQRTAALTQQLQQAH